MVFANRGTRIRRHKRVDFIVVAARYEADGGEPRLDFAQVYERLGPIWSDIRLYEREKLLQVLRDRKRVMTGRTSTTPGDFEVDRQLVLHTSGDIEWIQTETHAGFRGDDLGVPLV